MRIASLMLTDFSLIKDSGIQELSATFTEEVQLIIGRNGCGKAQPMDSLILTNKGWIRMGDVTLDTKAIMPDGTTASITHIYPQGLKDIYRITFEDGRSTECCDDHLWKIYSVHWGASNPRTTRTRTLEHRWHVVSLKDIRINMSIHAYKAGWFVELLSPTVGDTADLPIDPYVLGVILGDGHIAEDCVTLTTYDKFISDEISKLLPSSYKLAQRKTIPTIFSIIKDNNCDNPKNFDFLKTIRLLKLNNTRSNNKFIPDIYMNGSASQKLSLIQGLMDTDGYICKEGSTSFCTVSKQLALQFQEVIRSLGGLCKISEKESFYSHKGEKRKGQLAYILSIRTKDPSSLFRLPRKKERAPKNYQYAERLRLRIKHVEYVGKKEAQCIVVDHPDHLYITDEYIVTHNSSVLRQLSPYPAVRSLFGRHGFKSLVVEKDGVYYRLETEYEKPSSPHLFFEGDSEENLNISRTTQTQQELIIEHLGITPLLDDLIMNRYIFPKWTSSKRKEFLMSANPDQIGFVLTQIKLISSKIKACKNNLARLQSRKILLEQDLLDQDTLLSLNEEKRVINEDLTNFQQNLMDIEVGLRTTNITHTSLSLTDLPSIRKLIKRCHYQLSGLSHVNRDDKQRQIDRENLLSHIAVCDQQLQQADENIVHQSGELDKLETRYRELSLEGDLHETDALIQRLEIEISKLQITRPQFELSSTDLQIRYEELDELKDRLYIFSDLSVVLIPTKKRQRRERSLSTSQYKQTTYRTRLSDLQTQYETLMRRHRLNPSDIPDSPCAKDRCPLYSHFMGEYQDTESKRQSIDYSIQKGLRKIDRLDKYVGHLSNYFNQTRPYYDQIQWLVNYAQSNPVLHNVLLKMDILSVLSINPHRIIQQLQDAYDHIGRWLKLKVIKSDLETAYAFKNRQISSESHDTIKLVTNIELKTKSLYDLRQFIIRLSKQKYELENNLNAITTFSQIKSTMLSIQEQHIEMTKSLSQHHENDKLTLLKRGIDHVRDKHFARLGDIERILRAQSSLKERYQEEVLSQIDIIEKELADLQQIELALITIPKENMIGFINTVFDQANRLIDSIWTAPLKIELLSKDDPLTYEFQVSGDNETLRELSECSEGQTEILSLAINLSLRIVLGHLNYPICLDESGRTFDDKHKMNLIFLLRTLLNDKVISQLFLVNHHASIHEGFSQSETMVIREENVLLPEKYNLHCTFK